MALEFFAGCLGGMAGVIVGHPLDTVKVHMQTQDAQNPKYRGTLHCVRTLLAKEGVRGLYRGVTSPVAGVSVVNAIVFGVHGNVQKRTENPDSLRSHVIAGATAGFCQSFICSPMELAKSRLQVADFGSSGPVECLRKIYRTEGVKGVFRGQSLTICREVPSFAAYFFTYEWLTRSNDDRPTSTMMMLTAGGVAGMASWVLTYPVDVLKSRMQVDGIHTTKYLNVMDCLQKSVKTEGVSCLFKGLTPTIIRAFPVNAVTFTVVTWTMRLLSGDTLLNTFKETENLLEKCADVITLEIAETA